MRTLLLSLASFLAGYGMASLDAREVERRTRPPCFDRNLVPLTTREQTRMRLTALDLAEATDPQKAGA